MICPDCGDKLQSSGTTWFDQTHSVVYCITCSRKFLVNKASNELITFEQINPSKIETSIPELPYHTKVIINNRDHVSFMEVGEIINKSHKFYRVRLHSSGTILWVPEHWVEKVPEWL